ncbi:hypothetical protein MMC18_003765 [Xylographa bjoerkii]|nr:hypothetical protein [Xylographa bjoerkii]
MAFNTAYDPMDDSVGTQNERIRTPSDFDEAEINADDMYLAASPRRDVSESPVADGPHPIHPAKRAFTMPEGAKIVDLDQWVPRSNDGTFAETIETSIKKEPNQTNMDDVVETANIQGAETLPEIVVAVDKDDDNIKKEGDGPLEYVWNDLTKGTIVIPDDEQDTPNCSNRDLHNGSAPISSTTKPNSTLLKKTLLTTKKPKQTFSGVHTARMMEIQRQLAERSTGKPLIGGVGNLFQRQQAALPFPSGDIPSAPTDPNAWMYEVVDDDEDPSAKFAQLTRKYQAKQRARTSTFADDVEFLKAQKLEKARLKRIEDELLRARSTQHQMQEEVDRDETDDLFVSPTSPAASPSKRKYSDMVENEEAAQPGTEQATDSVASLSKRLKAASRSAKRLAKKDLDDARFVGVEAVLAKNEKEKKKKDRPSGKKSGAKPKEKSSKSEKDKSKAATKAKKKATKPVKPAKDPMNLRDVGSLFSSNVYADANDNLDRPNAPVMTAKKKAEALKQLVASVPLEDRRMANVEKRHIHEATKTLGWRKCTPDGNGKWLFKGLKPSSALHNYQIQGAAWMHERETGTDEPFGGFSCDSMGFGKTLMSIVNMLSNPAPEGDSCRATLIIAPTSLLAQWVEEIDKHTNPGVLGVPLQYRHAKKLPLNTAIALLQQQFVVLASYGEAVKSYPKYTPPKELMSHEKRMEWWSSHVEENRGPLHHIHWYRIILDEAQYIKNHVSQTSLACRAIPATRRWLLSGTPVQNDLTELFAYFKFLHVRHTGSFDVFRENFCDKSSNIGNERLHSFLRQLMLRRTHRDSLFGAPLIKLPKNNQRTIVIDFGDVEKIIYDCLNRRYIQRINSYQRKGTLERSYSNVLAMLMALRQLTAHTFMLQKTIADIFEAEDIERLWMATEAEVKPADDAKANHNRDMLSVMRKLVVEKDNVQNNDEHRRSNSIEDQEDDAQLEETRPMVFKFRRILRELSSSSKWDALRERSLCSKCKDVPSDPHLTSCLHLYCKECLNAMAIDAANRDEDYTTCLVCSVMFTESRPCNGLKELGDGVCSDASQDDLETRPRRAKSAEDDMKWIEMDGKVLPSAKTAALVAQIEEWQKQEPESKIIVFTQFMMMIKIIGRICSQRGWQQYHGKMSQDARSKSIREFRDVEDKRILIASLKCGGVGLNLTMASRVICIDLWWNHAQEQQAFCRVFRIGQALETHITRFVVRNTVDEKLQLMQDAKQEAIDAAMGDDGTRLAKLSLGELMRLFGPVQEDAAHKEFIIVDDEDEYASGLPDIPIE